MQKYNERRKANGIQETEMGKADAGIISNRHPTNRHLMICKMLKQCTIQLSKKRHAHIVSHQISSSSPGRRISCPEPSYTKIAARQPNTDTNAINHQAKPTIPTSRPYPYHAPEKMGPMVRKAEDTDWPIP